MDDLLISRQLGYHSNGNLIVGGDSYIDYDYGELPQQRQIQQRVHQEKKISDKHHRVQFWDNNTPMRDEEPLTRNKQSYHGNHHHEATTKRPTNDYTSPVQQIRSKAAVNDVPTTTTRRRVSDEPGKISSQKKLTPRRTSEEYYEEEEVRHLPPNQFKSPSKTNSELNSRNQEQQTRQPRQQERRQQQNGDDDDEPVLTKNAKTKAKRDEDYDEYEFDYDDEKTVKNKHGNHGDKKSDNSSDKSPLNNNGANINSKSTPKKPSNKKSNSFSSQFSTEYYDSELEDEEDEDKLIEVLEEEAQSDVSEPVVKLVKKVVKEETPVIRTEFDEVLEELEKVNVDSPALLFPKLTTHTHSMKTALLSRTLKPHLTVITKYLDLKQAYVHLKSLIQVLNPFKLVYIPDLSPIVTKLLQLQHNKTVVNLRDGFGTLNTSNGLLTVVEDGEQDLRAVAMDIYTYLLLDKEQEDEFDLEEGVRVALHSLLSGSLPLRHSALESLTVLATYFKSPIKYYKSMAPDRVVDAVEARLKRNKLPKIVKKDGRIEYGVKIDEEGDKDLELDVVWILHGDLRRRRSTLRRKSLAANIEEINQEVYMRGSPKVVRRRGGKGGEKGGETPDGGGKEGQKGAGRKFRRSLVSSEEEEGEEQKNLEGSKKNGVKNGEDKLQDVENGQPQQKMAPQDSLQPPRSPRPPPQTQQSSIAMATTTPTTTTNLTPLGNKSMAPPLAVVNKPFDGGGNVDVEQMIRDAGESLVEKRRRSSIAEIDINKYVQVSKKAAELPSQQQQQQIHPTQTQRPIPKVKIEQSKTVATKLHRSSSTESELNLRPVRGHLKPMATGQPSRGDKQQQHFDDDDDMATTTTTRRSRKQSTEKCHHSNSSPSRLKQPQIFINKKRSHSYNDKSRGRARAPQSPSNQQQQQAVQNPTTHLPLVILSQLSSDDWSVVMEGFATTSRLMEYPVYKQDLHLILLSICNHIASGRSQVARGAIKTVGEIVGKYGGDKLGEDSNLISSHLFDKTTDTNKFIRADAYNILLLVMERNSVHRCVQILEAGLSHRNSLVRATAGRLLLKLMEDGRVTIETLLGEYGGRLLPLLVRGLQDGNQEVRATSRSALTPLASHPHQFESCLKRFVPLERLRMVSKSITGIKQDALEQERQLREECAERRRAEVNKHKQKSAAGQQEQNGRRSTTRAI